MPQNRNDRATLDTAHSFAEHAEPLRDLFIRNHLPEDFIEQLHAGIERLQLAIREQALNKSTGLASRTTRDANLAEARAALQHLDALMKHLLRDEPIASTLWDSARQFGRYVSRTAVQDPAPDPPAASTPASPDEPPAQPPVDVQPAA